MIKKEGNFVMTKSQNMPSEIINLNESEIEKLNYERYAYPDPMIQKRISAVYIKAALAWSNEMIGLAVGLHHNSVGSWIAVYKREGYEGLLSNRYGTLKSEMEKHSVSILDSLRDQPPQTAAEAAERIKKLTGLTRSVQQVRVFMKNHDLKFIKCGHVPSKANNTAQHEWVETELKPVIEAAELSLSSFNNNSMSSIL